MKIYFLSALPCALFINDAYFGITDTFERFAEVSLSDNVFARFCPQNAAPVGFFINGDLRSAPPSGVEVYLLKDALALYVKEFPPTDFSLSVIVQKRFENALVTVFRQGALQLTIDSPEGYFNATLPPAFSTCNLSCYQDLYLLSSPTQLALYDKKAQCLLCERVEEYSVDGDLLRATLPLSDRLSRFADCVWKMENGALTRESFTLRQSGKEESVAASLLPYAFFESVLLGLDITAFLSEELKTQSEKIRGFLGAFESVTLTDKKNVCGLVYKKAERLYRVQYYSVEVENGVICDIKG